MPDIISPPLFYSSKNRYNVTDFCNCLSLAKDRMSETISINVNGLSVQLSVNYNQCKFLLGKPIFPVAYETVQ